MPRTPARLRLKQIPSAFRRLLPKEVTSLFPTDMCGRKNTAQLASVRALRVRAASCKLKKGPAFFEKSNARSSAP